MKIYTCRTCRGEGEITFTTRTDIDVEICSSCWGTGEIPACGQWVTGDEVCDLPAEHSGACKYQPMVGAER